MMPGASLGASYPLSADSCTINQQQRYSHEELTRTGSYQRRLCIYFGPSTPELLPIMDIISPFLLNGRPCVLTRGHFIAVLTPPSVGLATHPSSPCTDLESNNVTGKQEGEK